MTKIFPHCTISVGLAPLADKEDFAQQYDKCGARSGSPQLYIYGRPRIGFDAATDAAVWMASKY